MRILKQSFGLLWSSVNCSELFHAILESIVLCGFYLLHVEFTSVVRSDQCVIVACLGFHARLLTLYKSRSALTCA